ncbi:zonular occludens toxin domain-containing protein [Vibrio crassostreae]|uniref:zonular occludens toxin domain-containing protein n=2 Tax=Vibrio crassostreae TaxID=246167 RepID=UPI00104C5640|nr:zonular occludens toxin domain-containing protein [Vibrio crassostreae]TCT61108.1 zona occludens toxin [Vibrio crassostreae]TCT61118.1 zona occludens toxin [Vibrio crassostreae]TCT82591.1 zona occludens toxin [Vibrio crassostreae]TCT82601.1 zona occludens toxin [Vibrio crassostreae]TCT94859.1 zona occludens toxin [Vibrio crassostreae]
MAVSFRHGSNGAYKTAYVTWFEVLPALREGRIVVTNIEGLKPKESIEELLGEKFPDSSRLIRIFSRSSEGVMLWQNWFNWMPIGAFIVIDECQDLYCSEAGFKREKFLRRPLSEFVDYLPKDFSELFYSRWLPVDPDSFEVGDVDDCERTQFDENNRLLYPFDFYGAFTRHRKYQWDIVMLTPDYTAIPTWLKGCAGEAYSHRSTDTFFRSRKPRIYNHSPKSTKTAPSTKADMASSSIKKIPIDVFALYKSTGTGGFNATKSDISAFKSPKFILAILIGVAAIGKFIWDLSYVLSDSDVGEVQTVDSPASVPDSDTLSNSTSGSVSENFLIEDGESSVRVGSSDATSQGSFESLPDVVNPFFDAFPVFNGSTAVYLTSVNRTVYPKGFGEYSDFVFRIDKGADTFYIRSAVLNRYGYRFELIDDCLIQVRSKSVSRVLTCPPTSSGVAIASDSSELMSGRVDNVQKSVDIFNLSKKQAPQG